MLTGKVDQLVFISTFFNKRCDITLPNQQYNNVRYHTGLCALIRRIFGLVFQVKDETTQKIYWVNKGSLCKNYRNQNSDGQGLKNDEILTLVRKAKQTPVPQNSSPRIAVAASPTQVATPVQANSPIGNLVNQQQLQNSQQTQPEIPEETQAESQTQEEQAQALQQQILLEQSQKLAARAKLIEGIKQQVAEEGKNHREEAIKNKDRELEAKLQTDLKALKQNASSEALKSTLMEDNSKGVKEALSEFGPSLSSSVSSEIYRMHQALQKQRQALVPAVQQSDNQVYETQKDTLISGKKAQLSIFTMQQEYVWDNWIESETKKRLALI